VVSPLLFAIYINDLPEEIEKDGGEGVAVGEKKVRCLLFADDIIMVDSSALGLQKSFDVAGAFARKWRFRYNFGPDKTAVMVCEGTSAEEEERLKKLKSKARWAVQKRDKLQEEYELCMAQFDFGIDQNDIASGIIW
jgi:hypothetical protein